MVTVVSSDHVLPGVGMEELTASAKVNRASLMDQRFRKWVAARVYAHLRCEWGHVPAMLAEQNFASVVLGGPIISRWPFDGDALLVVHDSQHTRVTVVFESEQQFNISGPQLQEVT